MDWKGYSAPIKAEHEKLGFSGRFGAGLPRTSDGSLLFLEHMLSKMKPSGSRVAIVLSGSPLFSGQAGSGESEMVPSNFVQVWPNLLASVANFSLGQSMGSCCSFPRQAWAYRQTMGVVEQDEVWLVDRVAQEIGRSSGVKSLIVV